MKIPFHEMNLSCEINKKDGTWRVELSCNKVDYWLQTAIYGKNFCTAAKDSFMLIMENVLRYAVLDKVTDFLLFLGKTTITLGMG